MSLTSWKDRLTSKQLAKKRFSDKICQRRMRQQSKRAIAETEVRLNLLLADDKAALINRILAHNVELRQKLTMYRSQLETTLISGKKCLEADADCYIDLDLPQQSNAMQVGGSASYELGRPSVDISDIPNYENLVLTCASTSAYAEMGAIMGFSESDHSEIPTNKLLEAVMMWNMMNRHAKSGLELLLNQFQLKAEPYNLTLEKLNQQTSTADFFPDLLESLIYDQEIFPKVVTEANVKRMTTVQLQRRAVAYCSYEAVRPWRKLFRSSREFILMFWAQYRYFLFLILPTTENYHSCPSWRRPSASSFKHAHPESVDLIVWPQLRETLLCNWRQYNMKDLTLKLIQSFEIQGINSDIRTMIRLREGLTDICLDEGVESILHNHENVILDTYCLRDYPVLLGAIKNDTSFY